MTDLVYFGTSNRKLAKTRTATFLIPSGHTCPGANECLSKFDRAKNKIVDGKNQEFRCYMASQEAAFPSIRRSADKNLAKLKAAKSELAIAELLHDSLPGNFWKNIRIHSGGDFFNAAYFKAWCRVANRNPERLFYAYTKSLPLWIANKDYIPRNLVLTASVGGKWDSLISQHDLKYAVVVYHPDVASKLTLEVDHDDSLARDPDVKAFALLLHGVQKAGSEASEAIKRLKKEAVKFSYGKPSAHSVNES